MSGDPSTRLLPGMVPSDLDPNLEPPLVPVILQQASTSLVPFIAHDSMNGNNKHENAKKMKKQEDKDDKYKGDIWSPPAFQRIERARIQKDYHDSIAWIFLEKKKKEDIISKHDDNEDDNHAAIDIKWWPAYICNPDELQSTLVCHGRVQ